MGINPCCMSLQKGVKVMAIIDIVLNILSIILLGFAIGALIALKEELATDPLLSSADITIGIVAFSIIAAITLFGLLLSIRLLGAAKNREMRFCKIWLIISIVIVSVTVVTNIVTLSMGTVTAGNVASSFIGLLYRLYMIWVVYAFLQELRSESSSNGVPPRLEAGVVYNTQVI